MSRYGAPNYDEDLILVNDLVESGVPAHRVKEIFSSRIAAKDLERLIGNGNRHVTHRSVQVEPDIKKLVVEMKAPDDFIDPLYQHLMKDPVLLNTGLVLDRSSVIGKDGELRFRTCPFSGDKVRGDVYPVTSQKKAIEAFKAKRDRNVIEIARKLIASGEFESFVDILDAVEHYVNGLGDSYLPLARELAAVWSGVREISNIMLLVESLRHHSVRNKWTTAVASGKLHDRIFRIIVSAEVFRSHGRRNVKGEVALSLYNERDMLVERCTIFDCTEDGRRSNTQNQVFGRNDRIVTKARPEFSYRLEYIVGSSSSILEVEGWICKIFPESSRRPSYKMRDVYGEEGVFIGPVDNRDRAHGVGLLEYDDGKRFVGKFYHGSMADGVIYRGARVRQTLKSGKWTNSIDEVLVQKYPGNMLIYDSSEERNNLDTLQGNGFDSSHFKISERNNLGPLQRKGYDSSYLKTSENSFFSSSRNEYSRNSSTKGDRFGAIPRNARASRTGMLIDGHNELVSEMPFFDNGSMSHGTHDAHESIGRTTKYHKKKILDVRDLPVNELPVFKNAILSKAKDERSRSRSPQRIMQNHKSAVMHVSDLPVGDLPVFKTASNKRTPHSQSPERGSRSRRSQSHEGESNFFGPHLPERVGQFYDAEVTNGPLPGNERRNTHSPEKVGPFRQSQTPEVGRKVHNRQLHRGEEEFLVTKLANAADFKNENLPTNDHSRRGVSKGEDKNESKLFVDMKLQMLDLEEKNNTTTLSLFDDENAFVGLEKNDSLGDLEEMFNALDKNGSAPKGSKTGFISKKSARVHTYEHGQLEERNGELQKNMNNVDTLQQPYEGGALQLGNDESDELFVARSKSRQINGSQKHVSLGIIHTYDEMEEIDVRDATNSTGRGQKFTLPNSPIITMLVDSLQKTTSGLNWKKILQSGVLKEASSKIFVSADKFSDIEGTSSLALTLYNSHDLVLARLDLFGHPPKKDMLVPTLYRLLSREESVVSKAAPGCYYQLEYSTNSNTKQMIEVEGLICKIIPESKLAPNYEMCDPEGHKGRYLGALNISGDAHGNGRLEYENGCTFVGQFQRGKLFNGAYYRGTRLMFTMMKGKWTDVPSTALQKKYPHGIQMHAKSPSRAKNVAVPPSNAEGFDESLICCFGV